MIQKQFMIFLKKLVKSLEMTQEKRWLIITVTSSTKFNPRGPNVTKIIKDNFHLLQSNKILKVLFPENSILVGSKRETNLKDLLLRSDPHNIKKDLLDNTKHGYKSFKKKCDFCNNFVDEVTGIKCFATGRILKIRIDSSCQTENVIYVAYCLNSQKKGVGSTVSWKPSLRNYESHIKKNVKSCKIVRHIFEECKGVSNLCFIIIDVLNNVDHFSSDETEELLLQKEQFWIGTPDLSHNTRG